MPGRPQPLSGADSFWLRAEDPTNLMVINGFLALEGSLAPRGSAAGDFVEVPVAGAADAGLLDGQPASSYQARVSGTCAAGSSVRAVRPATIPRSAPARPHRRRKGSPSRAKGASSQNPGHHRARTTGERRGPGARQDFGDAVDLVDLRHPLGDRTEIRTVVDFLKRFAALVEGGHHAVGAERRLAAELQTAGRGRRGRRWISPRGAGLTASRAARGPAACGRRDRS